MKVKLKDIGPEGVELTEQMDADVLGLTSEDYLHFTGVKVYINESCGTSYSLHG